MYLMKVDASSGTFAEYSKPLTIGNCRGTGEFETEGIALASQIATHTRLQSRINAIQW